MNWTFSNRTRTIDFLDVNISLTDEGHVSTRIFEKALNLHLYLPPHSCHPPGVLKGIIHGMMLRFHRLSTDDLLAQSDVKQLLKRLVLRGYSPIVLNKIMVDAYSKLTLSEKIKEKPANLPKDQVYLHLPYHPLDPPSLQIQKIYRTVIKNPIGEPHVSLLRTNRNTRFGDPRFILAYSKPPSLGTIFSPRKLQSEGVTPSVILSNDDETGSATNPNPNS